MNDEQAQSNLQLTLAWVDAMHRGEIARPRPPRPAGINAAHAVE